MKTTFNKNINWRDYVQDSSQRIAKYLEFENGDCDEVAKILSGFFALCEDRGHELSPAKRRGYLTFLVSSNCADFFAKQGAKSSIHTQLTHWLAVVNDILDISEDAIPSTLSCSEEGISSTQEYLLMLLKVYYCKRYSINNVAVDTGIADDTQIEDETETPLEAINRVIDDILKFPGTDLVNTLAERAISMTEINDFWSSFNVNNSFSITLEKIMPWYLQLTAFEIQREYFTDRDGYVIFQTRYYKAMAALSSMGMQFFAGKNVEANEELIPLAHYQQVDEEYTLLAHGDEEE